MKAPVRILVVDDDEEDFFIIKEYIGAIKEQQFVVEWCAQYPDALEKINGHKYDIYFIDYFLGANTGLDLIKAAIENNCENPLILLTGNGNRTIDMKAMEIGAFDYLVKTDLNTEKLERCIRYSLDRATSLKALRDNERRFRNIFERSKDTVFIANEQLDFTEINGAAYCLLEYSREQLMHMNLYTFIANPEDAVYIKKMLAGTGHVLDKEIEIVARDSGKKNCILTLSEETDINGSIYIQGIIHEITALKKAEKITLVLEKMNMASRMVRTMAHEIRNPLNNVLLSVEYLSTMYDNEEYNNYLDIIKRNGKRIGDQITELMNSSRPTEITVERRSLQSILNESIEAATDRISLHNIQLQRDYIADEAWIMADYDKLKIAFLNIIINAVESMQKGEGALSVSIQRTEMQYVVGIQDNGCGISNDNMMKLFEPYFTTKPNGSGLGLASVLNILKSHNATIDVDTQVKKGTIFKLFFDKAE